MPDPDSAADHLATPVPVVHRERLLANLATWADAVAARGVALRPHAKTHKTVEVARLQLEHGAVGLTVAKPSEGLALLPSGVDDVFVAYPIVGPTRTAQFLALAAKVHASSTVDHLDAATALSAAAVDARQTIDVLVDVDSGLRRTGLAPEAAVDLGVAADQLPGLRVGGVFTYAGYPAMDPDPEVRRAWAYQEAGAAVQVAEALRERGVVIERVSVGGTPTSLIAAEVEGVTEVRPGIYAFGDANDSRVGAMALDDCALRILATVVSRPARDRVVIDAGTKALAADPGLDGTFGWLPDHPHARFVAAWEEHGVVDLALDAGQRGGADLQVGDRVEVVPNHVCPAVNLAARLVCVEDGRVVDTWDVVAR
jgi:D-serine deaminase-like pyridoxal phosphate-dependent protein